MMHMSFWWGDELGEFFFKGFQINSSLSMTLLCLCLFILSILMEGLKVFSLIIIFLKVSREVRRVHCNFNRIILGSQNTNESQSSAWEKPILILLSQRKRNSHSVASHKFRFSETSIEWNCQRNQRNVNISFPQRRQLRANAVGDALQRLHLHRSRFRSLCWLLPLRTLVDENEYGEFAGNSNENHLLNALRRFWWVKKLQN